MSAHPSPDILPHLTGRRYSPSASTPAQSLTRRPISCRDPGRCLHTIASSPVLAGLIRWKSPRRSRQLPARSTRRFSRARHLSGSFRPQARAVAWSGQWLSVGGVGVCCVFGTMADVMAIGAAMRVMLVLCVLALGTRTMALDVYWNVPTQEVSEWWAVIFWQPDWYWTARYRYCSWYPLTLFLVTWRLNKYRMLFSYCLCRGFHITYPKSISLAMIRPSDLCGPCFLWWSVSWPRVDRVLRADVSIIIRDLISGSGQWTSHAVSAVEYYSASILYSSLGITPTTSKTWAIFVVLSPVYRLV